MSGGGLMTGVTHQGYVGNKCCRRLVRVPAAAILYFAGVLACRAQLANDTPEVNTVASHQPPPGEPQPPMATQPAPLPQPQDARMDIYGFAMMDTGYNFGTIDPNSFDGVSPVKLPSFTDEFGRNGNWFAGVRQTRFGVKGFIPTSHGEIRTIFEFELFGTGVDAGQTTFRLRHAWGEYRKIGAGQTWSVFMDPDVFPNSIEYWGPNGMIFFRNVQLRYTPWTRGGSRFAVAFGGPGAMAC